MYNKNKLKVQRGEIYFLNCGDTNGSIQAGKRPVVIVQNKVGNIHSGTTIVVPLTTKEKRMTMPTHITIKKDKYNRLTHNSTALCEQILTVNQKDLVNKIGYITNQTMKKIDKGLMVSIGLAKKEN